jgi:hypothetical protein
MNHYFRQPVLNSHILTAESLAHQIHDLEARQKCFEAIITQVITLVNEADWEVHGPRDGEEPAKPTKKRIKPKLSAPASSEPPH